jgi:hypothetical protein
VEEKNNLSVAWLGLSFPAARASRRAHEQAAVRDQPGGRPASAGYIESWWGGVGTGEWMPSVGEISGSVVTASFFPAVMGMMPCDWPWVSGFLG